MVIRRSDQRRRRVVLDEVVQTSDSEESSAEAPSGSKSRSNPDPDHPDSRKYTYGANRRNQLKTTDLLPKRFLSFGLVVLVLLGCIGMLNLAAAQIGSFIDYVGSEGQSMFALTGTGSLSSWFSSFLLIITGLASLQIYALRQHRCDDYRGTYRLWLWLSALFILASINCVVDLGRVTSNVAEAMTQQSTGTKKIWPLITIKILALSMIVARGLFEIRESRSATVLVVLVWVAYTSAIVMQIPAVQDAMVVNVETCYGNLWLLGHSLILLSLLAYARFIYLHAQGLIRMPEPKQVSVPVTESEPPVKKKRKKKTVANNPTGKRKQRKSGTPAPQVPKPQIVQAPTESERPPVPKPSTKTRGPVPKPAAVPKPGGGLSAEDLRILNLNPDERSNLSKSERRRLRKLEKRQRRAA